MAVVKNKDDKVAATVATLAEGFSLDDVIRKFKELHPSEWEKINRSFNRHERNTKADKSHPMPEPEKYLENALNVWMRKSKFK